MAAQIAEELVSASGGLKLLIMTDIHIRGEGKRIIGLDPLERLNSAIAHAMSIHSTDATALIITGDLAHSGKVEEYQLLKQAIRAAQDAGVPVHLMLGNHDNRDNFLQVFPETPVTATGGYVQQVLTYFTHKCILLDSLDGPPFVHDTHHGYLCASRLAWLDEQLQEAEALNFPVIVMLHHPPFLLGIPGMDNIRLKNDVEFMDVLCKYQCVKQIVCGHIHRTISGNCRGKPFCIFKSPCHQLPLDMHSTDCSLSTDEPGAYGILWCNAATDTIIAHTEDFELAAIGKDHASLDALPDQKVDVRG